MSLSRYKIDNDDGVFFSLNTGYRKILSHRYGKLLLGQRDCKTSGQRNSITVTDTDKTIICLLGIS